MIYVYTKYVSVEKAHNKVNTYQIAGPQKWESTFQKVSKVDQRMGEYMFSLGRKHIPNPIYFVYRRFVPKRWDQTSIDFQDPGASFDQKNK